MAGKWERNLNLEYIEEVRKENISKEYLMSRKKTKYVHW
jgi:hypothetical protein